ncbi:MAG: class I SAM-dependent methyltransferase [Candidatus Thorarchaeota archaeon]
MSFEFLTDLEYAEAFHRFGNIRKAIAELVHSATEGNANLVLDVPAGHGYLTAEFAHLFPSSQFLALGLRNDVDSHIALRKSDSYPQDVWTHVDYFACDAMKIPFSNGVFDLVINFLGLEDIKMTRGVEGIKLALSEMARVLDANGVLQISLVEYGEFPEEKLARAVWNATGLNPVFETREWYYQVLEALGLRLILEKQFIYPKKMTAAQAKEELKFACDVAPLLFSEFGVSTRSFESLWTEFGGRIKEHGMAYWSRIRVMLFQHDV